VASAGRRQDHPLNLIRLVEQHGRGSFRAIVAFLERMVGAEARVGDYGPVDKEPIRFRQDTSLTFSTTDVSHVAARANGDDLWPANASQPCGVMATFLGLHGAVSPLPSYFAEEVAQEGDDVVRDFLDVFHHRWLSLFYRAISRYDAATEFTTDGRDIWSKRVLALTGFDVYDSTAADREPPLPRWRLLRLAPVLCRPRCTAWSLETALRDVLKDLVHGSQVAVEQFIGNWVPIHESQQTRLGIANSRLGKETVLGRTAFDATGKFRITIGPMPRQEYDRLLTDDKLLPRIRAIVSLASRDDLEYDVALVLDERTLSGMYLDADVPPRLGADTFLVSQPRQGFRKIILDLARLEQQTATNASPSYNVTV
jgi:type VI secretion system protein ImpH